MSIIRKYIIKFNQRQQPSAPPSYPETSTSLAMRLRSGRQYSLAEEEEEEEPVRIVPPNTLIPQRNLINHRPNQHVVGRQRIQPPIRNNVYSIAMLVAKFCGTIAIRMIQSLPDILATAAGIHAIMQLLHPPEHRITVQVKQKSWFKWN